MSRFIVSCSLVLVFGGPLSAAPKEERLTVTYDVADLLYQPGTKKSGYDSLDEVIKEIVTTVNPKAWLSEQDGGNRLFEVNGKRLEIRAAKADHDEIKELLESLRIRNDLAIDVKATFLSVDKKWFEKEGKPLVELVKEPNDDCPGVPDPLLVAFWKNAETVQTGKLRVGSRSTSTIASLRQAQTVATTAVDENGKPVWGVEFTGVVYRAKTTVTPDRRFVTFTIDELFRDFDVPQKQDDAPRIKEKKRSLETVIADGGMQILAVPYTPKAIAARGRVLVLVIQPRFYIDAEEKELRGKKDDG